MWSNAACRSIRGRWLLWPTDQRNIFLPRGAENFLPCQSVAILCWLQISQIRKIRLKMKHHIKPDETGFMATKLIRSAICQVKPGIIQSVLINSLYLNSTLLERSSKCLAEIECKCKICQEHTGSTGSGTGIQWDTTKIRHMNWHCNLLQGGKDPSTLQLFTLIATKHMKGS